MHEQWLKVIQKDRPRVCAHSGGAYKALRKHFTFTTDQTGVVMINFEAAGANSADAILAGLEVQ